MSPEPGAVKGTLSVLIRAVSYIKNGKRIDYELKVSDERTDPEKEKRPLP